MWQFIHDNPVMIVIAALIFSVLAYEVAEMLMRSVNIAIHGWPPPHVDANGKFKEEKK